MTETLASQFYFYASKLQDLPAVSRRFVYSLLIGPKTISLTALTLSLAHAPNRETLPLNVFVKMCTTYLLILLLSLIVVSVRGIYSTDLLES